MIVVETMDCVNQQYKCGQTDWTMDLPKFNFLPPEDEEEDEDNGYRGGNHINIEDDDDDDGDSQPNQEIINIEDIKIKQEQQQ